MKTGKVAPNRCNGEGTASRKEMKKGFFLNGINIFSNNFSIDKTMEHSIPVFTHTTQATLILFDETGMAAEKTGNPSIGQFFIQKGFFHKSHQKKRIKNAAIRRQNEITLDSLENSENERERSRAALSGSGRVSF